MSTTEAEVDQDMGRLVMTVAGVQKQLNFGPNDLLSTATMLDGDKVSRQWSSLVLGSIIPLTGFSPRSQHMSVRGSGFHWKGTAVKPS